MPTNVNYEPFVEAGQATRFGANWPGKRCLVKTRLEAPCQKAAIRDRNRCWLHGVCSTGSRTMEGKARVIAANTKHGRQFRAHVEKVKLIHAELRRITYELKRDG